MKILMLGWEYPPIVSGGLGIASQGLAKELSLEHEVDFLLPKLKKQHTRDINLMEAEGRFDASLWKKQKTINEKLNFLEIGVKLLPYAPPEFFERKKETTQSYKVLSETEESELIRSISLTGEYRETLHAEISKFALIASQIATKKDYNLVHGHDWMTFQAGKAIKESVGIPFVAHIHSTEFDRNGSYANEEIIKLESDGLKSADRIITVSHKVKSVIMEKYHIPDNKISVVPNGGFEDTDSKKKRNKIKKIGFVGRFTHQKGPMKFLDITRELASGSKDIEFIMAGGGFLEEDIVKKIAQINLSSRIYLPGFLSKKEVDQLMFELDILIVPSASEPFGLVVLEALNNNTLVIASEGNGAGEFIPSMPQIAHWDIFSFCNTINHLISDQKRYQEILENCRNEAKSLTWKTNAAATVDIYKSMTS